ncbi:mitochondrial ATP synthase g subunit-domain-containing protein [Whalleya microplaca]|nr:mitochondrial ATP synthase g subunit-domain-containing protein [Whalleya microplaca]
MSSALARPVLRQPGAWSRMAARRFESSTASTAASSASKAAETAKESAAKASKAASEYSAKAAQGLSRVTSSAGPAIAGAAKGVAGSLSKVGGRTGKVIAFIERQIPLVVYWSKVGAELSKIVFRGQQMYPPPAATVQSYYQSALKQLQNPSALLQTISKATEQVTSQPASLIQRARNISNAQLAAGGVVAAECLGFFTVGEMIGRFKIIGYHGEGGAAHH